MNKCFVFRYSNFEFVLAMPELVVSKKKKVFFRVPFDGSRFTIGRSPENDLVLPDDDISRSHAVILCKDSAWFLQNLGRSGTTIDKKPVEKAKLSDGKRIQIGCWELLFVFESRQDAEFDREVETCVTRMAHQPNTQVLKLDSTGRKFVVLKPFLLISGPDGGSTGGFRRVDLSNTAVVLGSNPGCDVVINDAYVSGRHCRIVQAEGGFFLEDLHSTNGTFIGDVRVSRTGLKRKTKFVIGKTRICFDSEDGEEEVVPLQQNQFCGLVGQAESMRSLFAKIGRVAPTDQTVLIQGETGSGKELVARALHELSPRKGKGQSPKPYVILNCGAISSNLIESELFGHEKGAFTGAHSRRVGAFEQANGGTLFLDEVGELPLELQPKLLRVLENRTIRRVGGDVEIPVDVRVIAATHRNLSEQVKRGVFREDLFFRLFVIPLYVPSLRDRREDIPLLAEYFISQALPQLPKALSRDALAKLASHAWPGNIRELKNVILRSLVFCDGPEISAEHVELMGEEEKEGGQMTLDRIEKEKILEALDKTGDNKSKAADILGIAKSTLFKKLKDYGIAE